MLGVTLRSPTESPPSVIRLPKAMKLPVSVLTVSETAAVTGFTISGSSAPVAVTVTVWVELVLPSATVTS